MGRFLGSLSVFTDSVYYCVCDEDFAVLKKNSSKFKKTISINFNTRRLGRSKSGASAEASWKIIHTLTNFTFGYIYFQLTLDVKTSSNSSLSDSWNRRIKQSCSAILLPVALWIARVEPNYQSQNIVFLFETFDLIICFSRKISTNEAMQIPKATSISKALWHASVETASL